MAFGFGGDADSIIQEHIERGCPVPPGPAYRGLVTGIVLRTMFSELLRTGDSDNEAVLTDQVYDHRLQSLLDPAYTRGAIAAEEVRSPDKVMSALQRLLLERANKVVLKVS